MVRAQEKGACTRHGNPGIGGATDEFKASGDDRY